jgi:DNA-binding NtrC family response regulator
MNSAEKFVIVADRDVDVLKRARPIIEHEGFIPVLVPDGKNAYRALRERTNVIAAFYSLDIPYISGVDLIRYMKSVSELSRVPVVVLDDNLDLRLLRTALAAGAVASIQKPFNDIKFASTLRMITLSHVEGPGK